MTKPRNIHGKTQEHVWLEGMMENDNLSNDRLAKRVDDVMKRTDQRLDANLQYMSGIHGVSERRKDSYGGPCVNN